MILLATCLLVLPALPMSGAEQATTILELKATAPDWWTPEVKLAAQRAAAEGKLLNQLTGETFTPQQPALLGVTVPAGAPDYLFIRPGSLALAESGFLCTYNFIYTGGTQIGTAGHCPS